MKKAFLLLTAALALLVPPAAQAQLTFSLAQETLLGLPGQSVTFTGRVSNTLSGVELVGSSGSVTGPGTLADIYFPFGLPRPLQPLPFESGPFPVFDLLISPAAVAGEQILGSYNLEFTQAGQPLVRAAPFTVSVIPEPGSLVVLVGAAIPGMGLALRRRRGH